jgi:hypothetical protein
VSRDFPIPRRNYEVDTALALLAESSGTNCPGTNSGRALSPPSLRSRAGRRHTNRWFADNPFRRAVAGTSRGEEKLSATIRNFSLSVQHRCAPVSITSSHHSFGMVG